MSRWDLIVGGLICWTLLNSELYFHNEWGKKRKDRACLAEMRLSPTLCWPSSSIALCNTKEIVRFSLIFLVVCGDQLCHAYLTVSTLRPGSMRSGHLGWLCGPVSFYIVWWALTLSVCPLLAAHDLCVLHPAAPSCLPAADFVQRQYAQLARWKLINATK